MCKWAHITRPFLPLSHPTLTSTKLSSITDNGITVIRHKLCELMLRRKEKMKLAIAIAIVNNKPKDVSVEQYIDWIIKQLELRNATKEVFGNSFIWYYECT